MKGYVMRRSSSIAGLSPLPSSTRLPNSPRLLPLLIVLSLSPLSSRALTEGPYTYSVSAGKATITDFDQAYSGPLTISPALGGYPVTAIGNRAFYNCDKLTAVSIPYSVTAIGDSAFNNCSKLTAINVADANLAYRSEGGVLYNKAVTRLIQCPGSKAGDYAIPADVTAIDNSAFFQCSKLTAVSIPAGVTAIGDSAFYNCSKLSAINVADANPAYRSDGGVLYNKAMTRLIQCP